MKRAEALALALRRVAAEASMIEESSVAEEMGLPVDHEDVQSVCGQISLLRASLVSRAARLEGEQS